MQRRFAIIVEHCPSQMMARISIGYMRTTIGVHLLQQQSFWRTEFRNVVFASWFVSNHCLKLVFTIYWMVGGSSQFACC